MNPRRRNLAVAALAAPLVARAQDALEVVYPAPESALDRRSQDLVALLEAALSRTAARHGPYRLRPASVVLTEGRQVLELARGTATLRVLWTTPTREHARLLRPIPFDTRRGLLGLRVALIRAPRQPEFNAVRTLEDLRRFSVGQGQSWPDAKVYEAERIRLYRASGYEALFRMLNADRFDLFPRAVHEVQTEWRDRCKALPELAIERGLLLHYAAPYHFFVHREDQALATRLEQGLKLLQADGSFDAHLWQHHGEAVRAARLRERRLIRLRNPNLPEPALAHDLAFWTQHP